jgi:hypothetical protein
MEDSKEKEGEGDEEEKPKVNYSKQGKKNRAAGRLFETKVREDLERMGWIVNKWVNTIDYAKNKIVPAKRKYNPFMKVLSIGNGFPDFVCFKRSDDGNCEVIGLEVKGNGYLDQVEKGMCFWLIENRVFSKILIAKKNKDSKKTEIEYINFLDKYKKDIPIQ